MSPATLHTTSPAHNVGEHSINDLLGNILLSHGRPAAAHPALAAGGGRQVGQRTARQQAQGQEESEAAHVAKVAPAGGVVEAGWEYQSRRKTAPPAGALREPALREQAHGLQDHARSLAGYAGALKTWRRLGLGRGARGQ